MDDKLSFLKFNNPNGFDEVKNIEVDYYCTLGTPKKSDVPSPLAIQTL